MSYYGYSRVILYKITALGVVEFTLDFKGKFYIGAVNSCFFVTVALRY